MQTAGFNFPLATYLVLPEAELPGSEFGGGVAVVEQESSGGALVRRKLSQPVRFRCETRGGRAGKRRVGGSRGVALPAAVPLLPKREDIRSTPPKAASARTPSSPLCPQLKGRNRNLDGLKHLPRIA